MAPLVGVRAEAPTHGCWNGVRRKFGRAVTISSINGQKGQAGQANYSASKAGDLGISRLRTLAFQTPEPVDMPVNEGWVRVL